MKFGLIGYGYWGPNFARLLDETPHLELKYCADTNPESLRRFRDKYPQVNITENYEDILKDPKVTAVLIVTPTSTHFKIAQDALEAGKHVFMEKPLTDKFDDATQLVSLASQKELTLMVGHIFIYNPAVEYIRDAILSDDIGCLRHIHFQRRNLGPIRKDVNVLWDLAPHDISMALHFLDDEPISVFASGECYLQEKIHDVVNTHIKFHNKVLVNMVFSWIDPVKIRDITIVGEKKMIHFDDVSQSEKVKIFNRNAKIIDETTDVNFGEYQIALHSGEVVVPDISNREPLKEELMHFVDCIQNKNNPITDGENGRKVVQILEAMQKSLECGAIVNI